MSLRTRIVWYLSLVVLLYAGADYVIQKVSFMESFRVLEENAARSDVKRVLKAIEREKEYLAERCTDLASWDETYRFVLERDAAYIRSTLSPEALTRDRIHLLYICDMRGKVIWGRCTDSGGSDLKLTDFNSADLGPNHPLITSKVTYEDTGIWVTNRGALLVSAKPILDSRGKGPVRGTVILGRLLTDIASEHDEYLDLLRAQTGVDFEIWSAQSKLLQTQKVESSDVIGSHDGLVKPDVGNPDLFLWAYRTVNDVRGDPGLIVVAKLPRYITSEGATTVRYALVSTLIAGFLMVAVLLYLLQHNVLAPLARLTSHAVEIGRNEDTTKKLALERDDELGILSREFDSMMQKLAQSRAALVVAARQAGMSEIATGVLHNVGNVLNSVNVSASIVAEKTRSSAVADLRLAMGAVRESAGDLAKFLERDPRGAHLYPLLVALTEQLSTENATVDLELRRISEGIEHIKILVQSQQSYAGHAGVLEASSIAEIVDSAIEMTAGVVPEISVELVREYEELPSCKVERHRLIEILVNLLQNARQAMQPPELAQRRLTVRVRRAGDGQAAIEIEDTGVGIEAGNLQRVFMHGFTTKRDGHGFGLHASANAATEMNATLVAHSDGEGRGARFTLTFPLHSLETANAS
jgi:signal transduction histidine kinase